MSDVKDLKKILLRPDSIDQHFKCYLNNKMMILMTLIEHPELQHASELAKREQISLQDIYHHFLPKNTDPHHRHAFRWIELLLERYPNVSPAHLEKGHKMLDLVSEVFASDERKKDN